MIHVYTNSFKSCDIFLVTDLFFMCWICKKKPHVKWNVVSLCEAVLSVVPDEDLVKNRGHSCVRLSLLNRAVNRVKTIFQALCFSR